MNPFSCQICNMNIKQPDTFEHNDDGDDLLRCGSCDAVYVQTRMCGWGMTRDTWIKREFVLHVLSQALKNVEDGKNVWGN